MQTLDLYKWTALVDAEGRCDNYLLTGYVASPTYHDARHTFLAELKKEGELVLRFNVEKVGWTAIVGGISK